MVIVRTAVTGVMVLGLVSVIALANVQAARAEGDVSDFKPPVARCMRTSEGRILTSVGHFYVPGNEDFELVADTRLKPTTYGRTEFEDPSFTAFDESCKIVLHQEYPELAEVGFTVLDVPGEPLLQVAAISIFQPVDQVIWDEELFSAAGKSLHHELGFGSDRYEYSYVGPIPPDGALGVVTTQNDVTRPDNPSATPLVTADVYRWKADRDPSVPAHFVGPEKLDAGDLAALKLPQFSPHPPPFPLYRFIYGDDFPR